jgi:hypothetical protein
MAEIVKCIKSDGREIYLKNGSLYTVIFTVYIGETTFYRLKEIMNMLFEDWRFQPANKPTDALFDLKELTMSSLNPINDNEDAEIEILVA